jgi:hypothetical protein
MQDAFARHLMERTIVEARWSDAPYDSLGSAKPPTFVLDSGSTFELWSGVSGADYDEYVHLHIFGRGVNFTFHEYLAGLRLETSSEFAGDGTEERLADEASLAKLVGWRIVEAKQDGMRLALVFENGAELRSFAYDTDYLLLSPQEME